MKRVEIAIMKQFIAVALLVYFAVSEALNRPVYKILLAQKGFAQFLQYDIEVPPLREFTFCTWARWYDFTDEQTLFTYVAKGNKRFVRLWVEQGGGIIRFSVAGQSTGSVPVDLVRDTWTHLCLSYQSDYGAWAIYIDGRLAACEVSQALNGYVLPKGGSVLVGYGTGENGESNGIEGEVFGANMILSSTIEKNISSQIAPQYESMSFPRNKMKGNNKIKYTILGDLRTDDIKPGAMVKGSDPLKLTNDFSEFSITSDDHDIGFDFLSKAKLSDTEMLEISKKKTSDAANKNKMPFWEIVNKTGLQGNFKTKLKELSSSGTQELPTISLVETPPPVDQPNETFHKINLEFDKPPTEQSVYNMFSEVESNPNPPPDFKDPTDIETPPPPQASPSVYGQWSSSKFAGTVLNYLRSINFNSKPRHQKKKIPQTIPLTKISDSLPYASEYKISKSHGKISGSDKLYYPIKFQRSSFTDQTMVKRAKREKQINVEILEDDLRESILKMHAQTKAINVQVTNRGEIEETTKRHYSSLNDQEVTLPTTFADKQQPRPFKVAMDVENHRPYSERTFNDVQSGPITIKPFSKSIEYYVGAIENEESHFPSEKLDAYTRTLGAANKWHNTKLYSNDYTPRHIAMDTQEMKNFTAENIAEANHPHQAIRIKYVAKEHKTVPIQEDNQYIEQGRRLAQKVSGKSDSSKEISILRYNHGFLPGHMDLKKSSKIPRQTSDPVLIKSSEQTQNNFNKPIKIGNALNEGHVLGFNEEYTRKSFIGGDEKVPDINKHRSDFDSNSNEVPPSLRAQVCKSMENLYHRVLYVKPDGSIDNTHIISPSKGTNKAIEFILVNYQKCSIDDTKFEENPLILINWSKTPVRLFGGAYPQKTKDLCGFF